VHNFPNLDEIKNINKVYANINKNKNGKLNKYEAKKAFKEYLNTSTTEELNIKVDEIFNNIDNDKNGYIENEEFARAALDKSIFLDDKVLKFIFDFLDKDGSGQINFDEMKTVFGINNNKEAEGILVSLIKDIDTDNNGEISFNEFKKMMINIIHY
jgi:calcium-dependent protein kinase